jgi:hypothetical protein
VEAFRLIPLISLAGSIVGIVASFLPWLQDVSGVDLYLSYGGDFQAYVPFITLALSVVALIFCVLVLRDMRYWFVPYLLFFFGIAIMAIDSIFAMWVIGDVKAASIASIGYWITYVAGALIIVGTAVFHLAVVRRFG